MTLCTLERLSVVLCIADLIKVTHYNVTVYKESFNYYPSHIPLLGRELWVRPGMDELK